jgi:hypothetical protein
MLRPEFYVGVAQYAFIAFTIACLVGLIWAVVEQLLPDIFLSRHTVTYDSSARHRAIPVILVGALGLVASLYIWASGMSLSGTPAAYVIAAASAVIFDYGVMTFLMSATTRERVAS